jgi:hypothetical protein
MARDPSVATVPARTRTSPPGGSTLAIAFLMALFASTAPADASTTLATYARPSAVSAYGGVVAWSAYDPETKRFSLTVREGDATRILPIAPRKREFDAAVSRGPDGRPLIVYVRCARGCGIYGFDPRRGEERLLVRRQAPVRAPALWGRRVAWIERARGGQVVRAAQIGGRVRTVPVPVSRRGALTDVALHGRRLALAAWSPAGGSTGGREEAWLQQLDGSRRRLVDRFTSGEGGQTIVGLSFNGGALYYVKSCFGDPSGCGPRNAFRYRHGRHATANAPNTVAGFAVTGHTAYWITTGVGGDCPDLGSDGSEQPTCLLQRARSRFVPSGRAAQAVGVDQCEVMDARSGQAGSFTETTPIAGLRYRKLAIRRHEQCRRSGAPTSLNSRR